MRVGDFISSATVLLLLNFYSPVMGQEKDTIYVDTTFNSEIELIESLKEKRNQAHKENAHLIFVARADGNSYFASSVKDSNYVFMSALNLSDDEHIVDKNKNLDTVCAIAGKYASSFNYFDKDDGIMDRIIGYVPSKKRYLKHFVSNN